MAAAAVATTRSAGAASLLAAWQAHCVAHSEAAAPVGRLARPLVEVVVELVEDGRPRTVDLVPPLAGELFLIEDGAVWAQDGALNAALAQVDHLAGGLGVGVVAVEWLL